MFSGVSVLPVVLDLGAKDATEADQQTRLIRHRLHAPQQQKPTACRQRIGQGKWIALRRRDEAGCIAVLRAGQQAAEMGAWQRSRQSEATGHASPVRSWVG